MFTRNMLPQGAFMGVTGDFNILVRNPLLGVQDDQGHVAPFETFEGLDDREFFQPQIDFGLAPDAGGIDQAIGMTTKSI